jgi:hypothetical protein
MSAADRENEVCVGTVADGEWQEVHVNVYDFRRRPYVSLAVHRVNSDGGGFIRGFAMRPSLWRDVEPVLRRALELAAEREDQAILEASMGMGKAATEMKGWRRPR